MNGIKLENVNSYKYLGVTLDADLNFKQHVNNIREKKKKKSKTATDLYKTMSPPLLDYGDVFYQSPSRGNLDKLRVLRKRAVRTIARRENVDSECEKRNILPLQQRRLLHLLQHGRWIARTGKINDT